MREFGENAGLKDSILVELNKRKVPLEIRKFVDLTIDKWPPDQKIKIISGWLSFLRQGEDKETGNDNVNGEGDKTRTKNLTFGP